MTDFAVSSAQDRADHRQDAANFSSGEQVRKIVVVGVCLIVFFLSAFADVLNSYIGVALLTVALLVGLPRAGRSSLASTIAFCGVALFTMPYIGLIYVDAGVEIAWFALYIIVGIILVTYGEPRAVLSAPAGHGTIDLTLIAIYLIAGLTLWGGEGLRQVSFYAGWALALVHLERVYANTTSPLPRWTGLIFFVLVIGFFVTVLWSGGGRIVQLSFALAPIFLAVHYRAFPLNAFVLGSAAAILSFVGRVLRFGWSDGVAGLSEDSGASPITITSYLWQTKDTVLARGSILDQWELLFVNWYPRNLWPNKPLGVGSTFVDLVTGRQGVSEEHNLAIGFFGEHMFYLPNAWFLSVALLVAVLILVRRVIVRLCNPYRTPAIIFDVWLITLFWGGMAAFAARIWFAFIPLIPYMILIRWIDRRRAPPMNEIPEAIRPDEVEYPAAAIGSR